MKRMNWIFALLLTSFVWVSCDDDDDSNNNVDKFGDEEQSFIQLAAQSNFNEIELSQLALTQGRDSLVRSYAQQMIEEHTTAQDELQEIADKHSSVAWPSELTATQQTFLDSLSGAEGYQFDTMFMNSQVRLHQQAVSIFQNGTNTDDTDTKAYANKYLPKIQDHLQMADSLNTQIPQRWEDEQNGTGEIDGQ